LPDSRPNVELDASGRCNGATTAEKQQIDWQEREILFSNVVENSKSRSQGHDCLIPVSGGKDSTWQVIKCLEYGLNPLCVTWKTPVRTELGQRNLDNLISLGVDHIDYRINPKVERQFLLRSFEKLGTTALPMHMALFAIPLTLATRFSIPLVVWGENSAFEYGGTKDQRQGFKLDSNWLKRYGVTHGTTATDWISDDLNQKALTPYFMPDDNEIEAAGVRAVFLGYYFPWDPVKTYEAAKAQGFEARAEGAKTGYYAFADIDDDFIISIHHFMKWYKFGFTRLWDNLALEIRHDRMTREEAISIIAEHGDETPHEDIASFCRYVNISETRFFEIADSFRNTDIWRRDKKGAWHIPDFLIPDWHWS
jgi:N-acetyl sugar amidotransferase